MEAISRDGHDQGKSSKFLLTMSEEAGLFTRKPDGTKK